jgi:hypothetical protein
MKGSRRYPRDLVCDALAWRAQDKTAPGSGRRFLRRALEHAHHGFADNLHGGSPSSDGHHDIWLARGMTAEGRLKAPIRRGRRDRVCRNH